MISPSEMERILRKVLEPNILGIVYDHFIEPSIGWVCSLADQKIGPRETRIGVFGPYPEGGEKIINEIAKIVSKHGSAAITGKGFYIANEPGRFHVIDEIMPQMIGKIKLLVGDRRFFYHFPRLVNKAIFNMHIERTQVVELQGCYDFKIPMMGFIRHEDIGHQKKNKCNFLTVKNSYSECIVPSRDLCIHEVIPRLFCPFYDSVDIPWSSKQLFLTEENRLVAIEKMSAIETILKEFISDPE